MEETLKFVKLLEDPARDINLITVEYNPFSRKNVTLSLIIELQFDFKIISVLTSVILGKGKLSFTLYKIFSLCL